MDKRTRSLYNDAIFQEALARFGISSTGLRELGGFESFLYEYDRDGKPFILRVSHSLHHPPNRTQAEMDFLNYLSGHGLSVPHPIPSRNGNLVEVIEAPAQAGLDLPEHTFFSTVSFDKAPGGKVEQENWTPELFHKMGRFMGRMHALTRHYTPTYPAYRRHDWY